VSLISRDQSTMQPAGASALAEGHAQSVARPYPGRLPERDRDGYTR
jgi:hypothetical protein